MSCAAFRDDVAAYALGMLDPDDDAACARHLGESIAHDRCEEAFAAATETVSKLTLAQPEHAPPPRIWLAIQQAISGSARASKVPLRRRWPLAIGWGLAAAATVVAVVLAQQRRTLERDREALLLLSRPGVRVIAMEPTAGGYRASVIIDLVAMRAVLVGSGFTPRPGRDFDLWFIRGEKGLPAGLLRSDGRSEVVATIESRLLVDGPPNAFAVTVERQGGASVPAGSLVLIGKL